jgi:DNA-directed RNA polymerase subunit delta
VYTILSDEALLLPAKIQNKNMKPKSDKENEFPEKKPETNFSKTSSKKKEDDLDNDVKIEDDWEKTDDDEDYDPDFEEFDIPKSKIKKPSKKGKSSEDFDLDEDFKDIDLFKDGTDADDDEDEF